MKYELHRLWKVKVVVSFMKIPGTDQEFSIITEVLIQDGSKNKAVELMVK
jgi:hypothetical protein